MSSEAKWELAEAMWKGTNGLQRNPARASELFAVLAGVRVQKKEDGSLETIAQETSTEPFAPAMRRLAECYLEGNGVEADPNIGVGYLEAAHSVGMDADAAHELALIYEYGKYNVKNDVYLAADYFLKAAQGGHVEAMAEYAMCCELGCGTDQSDELALEWYLSAANAGHVTAKYSVGEAFEEARGVPQSDEEACLWYYKAAVCGDEDSKKALRRLHDIARIVVPGVASILEE
jgi:TPR repeat protein